MLIQALLFFNYGPVFAPDSALYQAHAESLASTGVGRNAMGEPDTVLTPGYPLFLAAFLVMHLGYGGAVFAQRLLWIGVVAATTWVSFRLSGRIITAAVAGLILAIDLPALQATNSILSETIATIFVIAAVWQAYRSITTSGGLITGVLAGAAALVRPVAILLSVPLALGIVLAGRAHRVRIGAAILVASLAVSSIWIARNYLQTGVATYSSLGGINLLLYRAAGTLAIRDPGGIDANLVRRREELEAMACRNLEAEYQRPCVSLSWAQRSREYATVAWPIILGDPVASARQAARGLGMIVFGGSANLLSEVTGLSERVTRVLSVAMTAPLAVLALLGIPYWWKRDRAFAALILLVVLYMFGMALGAEAYSRFRVPVIVLYAVLCGGGAARIRLKPDTT